MSTKRGTARDLAVGEHSDIAMATVGGLYLVTHSVVVTLIGAAASTVLTCWFKWLTYKRDQPQASRERAVKGR